jgi:PhzF family phenazine biosynthesis protein
MPATFPYSQVNVFSADPLGGNPLAVVHAAEALSDAQMAALARWTNLSETTFLLPPTDPGADYRVRIFTPARELPFAGHPTLGSCHAWLAARGKPARPDVVMQQCGAGLVRVRCDGPRLEFAAPRLRRSGELEPDVLAKIAKALRLQPSDIERHQWADNGPGWCAVMLRSAEQVLALKPDWAALDPLKLGVIGPHAPGHDAAFEVRAFIGDGGYEDPVTGSLNASVAQWLFSAGLAEPPYIAAQGAALGRAGRVYLRRLGGEVWVGGDVVDVVRGTLTL